MDDMEIVSAVQQALADKVGTQLVAMWATSSFSWQREGDRLTLLAPDSFRLKRLQKYRAALLDAACQVLGPQATVDLKIGDADPAKSAAEPSTAAPIKSGPVQREFTAFQSTATPSSPLASPPLMQSATIESAAALAATDSPAIFRLPSGPVASHNASSRGGSAESPASTAEPASPTTHRMARRNFASLDAFIVGEGNRLAHAAVNNLLIQLGRYSPLFISGPPGSGKTHLLEGAWRTARQTAPHRRTIYLSAEQFTTQFVEALRGSGLPSFRRKYRDVELLLIDDLQFFAGKPSTLTELQHTVDTLLRAGRQIVFAADRGLPELKNLGSELVARIGGGLVCGIDAADLQTRLGILEQLAGSHETPTPRTVLEWLATQLDGDARQLAGALNRLHATSEALHCRIDLPFAQRALADLVRVNRKAVRLADISNTICEMFGIDEQSLQSESKSPVVSHPRMLAMWLARKYTRAALSEIGKHFGRKSHTTVISAEDKVSEWLVSGKKNLMLPEGDCRLEDVVKRVESQLRLA
jgi:chromosomal replication initiator protein